MSEYKYPSLNIAVTGLLVLICGCESVRGTAPVNIDQSTPRTLMVSYEKAIQARNFAEVLACWPPRYRPHIDPILVETRRHWKLSEAMGNRIREKFGNVEGDWFDKGGDKPLLSPFRDARVDGNVDWSRIELVLGQDSAQPRIGGRDLDFPMQRINGKWYVIWELDSLSSAAHSAAGDLRFLKAWRRGHRESVRRVKDPRYTKTDFWYDMWNDDALPGPKTSGVEMTVSPWAGCITYRKDDALKFQVRVWGTAGTKLCWRVPKGGSGENVTVEVDGEPVELRPQKADHFYGVGHPSLEGYWEFTLPKDVRLQGEWHTIRYTIASGKGVHRTKDGIEIPLLAGKLVSNTLRFRIGRFDGFVRMDKDGKIYMAH